MQRTAVTNVVPAYSTPASGTAPLCDPAETHDPLRAKISKLTQERRADTPRPSGDQDDASANAREQRVPIEFEPALNSTIEVLCARKSLRARGDEIGRDLDEPSERRRIDELPMRRRGATQLRDQRTPPHPLPFSRRPQRPSRIALSRREAANVSHLRRCA